LQAAAASPQAQGMLATVPLLETATTAAKSSVADLRPVDCLNIPDAPQ
jgi:hypothetical protein